MHCNFSPPLCPTLNAICCLLQINIYLKIIRTVSLYVKKSGTVKDVKALLHGEYGFSESLQELCFNGDCLRDGQRLLECGVDRDSTLHLVVRNPDEFKIYVKLPSNPHTMVVEARALDTVRNIKAIIETKEGIELDQFTLVYHGQLLEDDSTLVSLNIQNESTLHVVLNPKAVLSISVKLPRGEIIKLKARALFTVSDVKTIVGSIVGESVSDHTMFYAGKNLDDFRTLAFYDIMEESVLEILPLKFQIFVKSWDGKTITLSVERYDSIKNIKEKFFHKLNLKMPAKFLSLVFSGKMLVDSQDLGSYNIQQHSTLIAVYTPCAIRIKLANVGGSVTEHTTIHQLKNLIQRKRNIHVKEIYFQGVALQDDHRLSDYGAFDSKATFWVVSD